MEKLQQKIEEKKQKKEEIETSRLTTIKEQMVQEVNIGLKYVDVVYMLDEEVQKLKYEYFMNNTNIILPNKRLLCRLTFTPTSTSYLKILRLAFRFKFSTSRFLLCNCIHDNFPFWASFNFNAILAFSTI